VPSSIFSSSDRAPGGPWLKVWLSAIFLTILFLACAEWYWRSQDARPSVTDTVDLWSSWRNRVYDEVPGRPLVLLGASRMQLDFSNQTFRNDFPEISLVNLAIDGQCPLATLEDLAADEEFIGTALVSITAACFLRKARGAQSAYVQHYRSSWTLNRRINAAISAWIQSIIVSATPHAKVINLIKDIGRESILGGSPRQPNYMVTYRDRDRSADYTMTDIEEMRRKRIDRRRGANDPLVPAKQWLIEVLDVEPWIEQIHARGGRVIFARFPTSGEHLELDEMEYPRSQFWDAFAVKTKATTIHFKDIIGASDIFLPDTSHMDASDAPEFTRMLTKELATRGVLDSRE